MNIRVAAYKARSAIRKYPPVVDEVNARLQGPADCAYECFKKPTGSKDYQEVIDILDKKIEFINGPEGPDDELIKSYLLAEKKSKKRLVESTKIYDETTMNYISEVRVALEMRGGEITKEEEAFEIIEGSFGSVDEYVGMWLSNLLTSEKFIEAKEYIGTAKELLKKMKPREKEENKPKIDKMLAELKDEEKMCEEFIKENNEIEARMSLLLTEYEDYLQRKEGESSK